MPRRPRLPREPVPPKLFTLSDDVAEVGNLVIAKHGVHFDALRPLKIAYVLITGGKPPKRDRVDGVWARFLKAPPVWKTISGFDAIVWVRDVVWRALSAEQREALIAHQLSHASTNDKGELTIVPHDSEEFAWVARHYGGWNDGVKLFGQQLSLFGTPDGARPNGTSETALPKKDDEGVVDLATHAQRAREGRDKAPVVHP